MKSTHFIYYKVDKLEARASLKQCFSLITTLQYTITIERQRERSIYTQKKNQAHFSNRKL